MRYKFIILFLLIGFVSKAQVYQIMPQYGYTTFRMNFDSTIQIPTFCGVPRLGSNVTKKGALAFDSCNNRFYFFNPKLQAWDTIKSADASLFVKYSDTAQMLSAYLRKADTIFLSNRIDQRVKYTDSAAMLLPYLRKIDTTNKFVSSVTKLNDSTIQVIKGTTTSNITISSVTSATRLITRVWNNTGATILRGSVVYISGRHSSNLPTIALAEANNEENSYKTFALVDGDIADNSAGIVIQAGNIGNLNLPTSSYVDGDILYLSPTVPGGYTTTKPLAPYHICKLGSVTRAHPTFGSIEIKIENGWQLDELSDVSIPIVPADSVLLQFSRVDSLWHDVSPLVAIGNRYVKPSDTTNKWITNVFRKTASDSVFFVRGGTNNFAFRDSTGAAGWGLLGNSGTSDATNFLGTTDNQDLVFRRNNVISGVIDSTNQSFGNGGRTTLGFRTTGTGTNTTAFGFKALQNASGTSNTAVGNLAGATVGSGQNNTMVGQSAMSSLTSGGFNVAVGSGTLQSITTFGLNTAIGYAALQSTQQDFNIGIGAYAGFNNTNVGNQIFINSLLRANYSADQTQSPFYAQQNATVANQIVTLNGRIGINTISPSASAGLEVSSTTQGFLQPRLTTTQMNAISTPATGLSVFNTTDSAVYIRRGTGAGWQQVANEIFATASLNFASTNAQNSSDLTITLTGAVDGDAVSLGVPNAAVNANSCYTAWVSSSGVVTVRFNNYSSGAIDPAQATFKVTIIK